MSSNLNMRSSPETIAEIARRNRRVSPVVAAQILGLSVRTLSRYRRQNAGPPFDRSGNGQKRQRILYPVAALEAWARERSAARMVGMTAEPIK